MQPWTKYRTDLSEKPLGPEGARRSGLGWLGTARLSDNFSILCIQSARIE